MVVQRVDGRTSAETEQGQSLMRNWCGVRITEAQPESDQAPAS